MGAGERRPSNRISYGRNNDPTAIMEKPVIRVKEAWKVFFNILLSNLPLIGKISTILYKMYNISSPVKL